MAVTEVEQNTIEEELDGTTVGIQYKVQLLEHIIDDSEDIPTISEIVEDWSDVPVGTFTILASDVPDESKGGIGTFRAGCVKPGETSPVGNSDGADAAAGGGSTAEAGGPASNFNVVGGGSSANAQAYNGANQGQSRYNGARTKLGWAIGPANTKKVAIPGMKSKFIVTIEVWPLWTNFIYDFHQEVESVNNPSPEGSLCIRPIRGYEKVVPTKWSNHSTGTAVDLNYGIHPLKAIDTFSPPQRAAIAKLLSRYEGIVRWGGNYSGRRDDMHWEIDKTESVVKQFTQKKNLVARAEQISSGQLPLKNW